MKYLVEDSDAGLYLKSITVSCSSQDQAKDLFLNCNHFYLKNIYVFKEKNLQLKPHLYSLYRYEIVHFTIKNKERALVMCTRVCSVNRWGWKVQMSAIKRVMELECVGVFYDIELKPDSQV